MRILFVFALFLTSCERKFCVTEVEAVSWNKPVLDGASSSERLEPYLGEYSMQGTWYDGAPVVLDIALARGDETATGLSTKRSPERCKDSVYMDLEAGLHSDDGVFDVQGIYTLWMIVEGRDAPFSVTLGVEPDQLDRDFTDLYEAPETPISVEVALTIDDLGDPSGEVLLFLDEDELDPEGASSLDRSVQIIQF